MAKNTHKSHLGAASGAHECQTNGCSKCIDQNYHGLQLDGTILKEPVTKISFQNPNI